jgi:predicted ATPase
MWGKAGQRSLERSALVEAAAHLTRALAQITDLPSTVPLRREQIKLQVALVNALMHTKGHAAPDTKASIDRAYSLIERAQVLGEPPEDPLLLFSVLYGFWGANYIASNGDVMRQLAVEFLALAEKQKAAVPLMIGSRIMGTSLLMAGYIAESRAHHDRAIALYDPAKHRPLAMRFGQDRKISVLSYRSLALWILGYPDTALADTERTLKHAREIGHPVTSLFALTHASFNFINCGYYEAASAQAAEAFAVADKKGASFWKTIAVMAQGCVKTLTGDISNGVQTINSGINQWRSMGSSLWLTYFLPFLVSARAHAELGQFEDAWRSIGEAMTTSERAKEKFCEADIHRTAAEIALMQPEPDVMKAEGYFEHALAIARSQQAKSWELRAAMSMARLWRGQGKRQQAHDLLAPVYGWFTEGFDTPVLKDAKALLDQLA